MLNYCKIPYITPFKFVRYGTSDPLHFDDDWAYNLRTWYEKDVRYKQKWVRGDTTKIQVESTIWPDPLMVYNAQGQLVHNFVWVKVFQGVNYMVFECTVNFNNIGTPNGIYFLYHKVEFGSVKFQSITEPIDVKDSHPNTIAIRYKHMYNDYDVAWSTGIEMLFRVEAGIHELTPERERTTHVNQTSDVKTLYGVPSRSFKLLVGLTPGVAEWVVDLLNRIFLCSSVVIKGMAYQNTDGAKWEVTRVKGYPLVGANIEVAEAYNNYSLEFATDEIDEPLSSAIVTAYNIETAFFGPGTLIPITDIEEQS